MGNLLAQERATMTDPKPEDVVPPKPEDAGEKDAEEGVAGYGQAPPGVRTTKLGTGPEYDWGRQPAGPDVGPGQRAD